MRRFQHHLGRYLVFVLIILVLIVVANLGGKIDFWQIVELIKQHYLLGTVIYILYSAISTIVITLPVVPLWPVALYVYHFWPAVIFSLTGMLIGASIDFWLARKYGHTLVQKMMGEKLFYEIEHFVQVDNLKIFLLMRLLGTNYFDPLSYIAGLSKMTYKNFIIITATTSTLWVTLMLYIINRVGGLENMKGFLTIMGIYGGFVLAGAVVWEIFHQRHKKKFKVP